MFFQYISFPSHTCTMMTVPYIWSVLTPVASVTRRLLFAAEYMRPTGPLRGALRAGPEPVVPASPLPPTWVTVEKSGLKRNT